MDVNRAVRSLPPDLRRIAFTFQAYLPSEALDILGFSERRCIASSRNSGAASKDWVWMNTRGDGQPRRARAKINETVSPLSRYIAIDSLFEGWHFARSADVKGA